jgi:membrane protein required for colicin V production
MRLLGRILSGLLEAICLGFVDKIGGFVFGALKGILLVSIIVMIMNVFNATNLINEDLRDSSRLFTFTESIADMLYENHEDLEDTIEDAFEKSMDKMEDKMEALEDIVETI